jgi:hypothetical protein
MLFVSQSPVSKLETVRGFACFITSCACQVPICTVDAAGMENVLSFPSFGEVTKKQQCCRCLFGGLRSPVVEKVNQAAALESVCILVSPFS